VRNEECSCLHKSLDIKKLFKTFLDLCYQIRMLSGALVLSHLLPIFRASFLYSNIKASFASHSGKFSRSK